MSCRPWAGPASGHCEPSSRRPRTATPAQLSAIEAVILLDDALAQFRGLRDKVPGLLAAAEPGPTMAADIKARADELMAVADQVASARHELDVLKAGEQEVNARLAELSAFREQIDELRRRERLVTALHEPASSGR